MVETAARLVPAVPVLRRDVAHRFGQGVRRKSLRSPGEEAHLLAGRYPGVDYSCRPCGFSLSVCRLARSLVERRGEKDRESNPRAAEEAHLS